MFSHLDHEGGLMETLQVPHNKIRQQQLPLLFQSSLTHYNLTSDIKNFINDTLQLASPRLKCQRRYMNFQHLSFTMINATTCRQKESRMRGTCYLAPRQRSKKILGQEKLLAAMLPLNITTFY